jgi:hypothetical protein
LLVLLPPEHLLRLGVVGVEELVSAASARVEQKTGGLQLVEVGIVLVLEDRPDGDHPVDVGRVELVQQRLGIGIA